MTPQSLTPKQATVLMLIEARRGNPPTVRELMAWLGVGSENAVYDHLRALKRKGYLRWNRYSSRTMVARLPDVCGEAGAIGRAKRRRRRAS